MRILKFIFETISWLILLFFGGLLVLTIGSNTNLFGEYKSFLIQSGSMEPSIHTGDIIVILRSSQYTKNDVVTFHTTDQRIVTHRIIEKKEQDNKTLFLTKGDANEADDDEYIQQKNILGKVVFVVPKLGFMVAFAKSLPGLILLILIPTLTLLFDEGFKLFHKKNL